MTLCADDVINFKNKNICGEWLLGNDKVEEWALYFNIDSYI